MESVCSSCQDNQPTVNSKLSEAVRADAASLTVPGQEEGRWEKNYITNMVRGELVRLQRGTHV